MNTKRPTRLNIFSKNIGRGLLCRVSIAIFCVTGCETAVPEDVSTPRADFSSDSIITVLDTIFKVENSEDANEDDCKISGQHRVIEQSQAERRHVKVKLAAAVPGCANERKEGWIFAGHILDPYKNFTLVRTATLLDNDKKPACQVEPTFVRMLTEPLDDGDFVKFRPVPSFIDRLPDKCPKLSTYYVSRDSYAAGVQAISLKRFAFLKSSPSVQDSELTGDNQSSVKDRICHIPPGLYVTEQPVEIESGHYKVVFPTPISQVPLKGAFKSGSELLNNPEVSKILPDGKMACDFSNSNTAFLSPGQTALADARAAPDLNGDYFYPLKKGQNPRITDSWCIRRRLGSSPHIGTDFGGFPSVLTSQAIFSGTIDKIESLGSCGYAVWLHDDRGGLWRYLHCNKPKLSEGQRVNGGDEICKHSTYPKKGCGRGRHLHLERHKLGKGYPPDRKPKHKGCNFDSESLFMAREPENLFLDDNELSR